MMKKAFQFLGLSFIALGLAACQSTPQEYNGQVGYRVESQTSNSATIAYTLAGRQNQDLDAQKLQRACEKVLNSNKTYKIQILSVNEIANPTAVTTDSYGRQIGNSRTSIGLSNTPDLHNSEDYATRQALEARPSTLRVVRYSCS